MSQRKEKLLSEMEYMKDFETFHHHEDSEALDSLHHIKVADIKSLKQDYKDTVKRQLDNLNVTRQVDKELIGPAVLMSIFGKAEQIGKEKGYEPNSWLQSSQTDMDLMASLKRHLKEFENGERGSGSAYTEFRRDGSPCPTPADHTYAIFFNAAALAIRTYFGRNVDDRFMSNF
jgi:hypothetical protein